MGVGERREHISLRIISLLILQEHLRVRDELVNFIQCCMNIISSYCRYGCPHGWHQVCARFCNRHIARLCCPSIARDSTKAAPLRWTSFRCWSNASVWRLVVVDFCPTSDPTRRLSHVLCNIIPSEATATAAVHSNDLSPKLV